MKDFVSDFEQDYRSETAPWVIGGPQPAVVALERDGWFRGSVLDAGCGTGEHTIFLARQGYQVTGIDSSREAIRRAEANAVASAVAARFVVGDATELRGEYDTVLDSGLFHVYGLDRARYVRSLREVTRPGAWIHVLALADLGPRYGPQISDRIIREAFSDGWVLEDLRLSAFRCRTDDGIGDAPAWLARVRRADTART